MKLPSLLRLDSFASSMQLALWIAMLSVVFQQHDDLFYPHSNVAFWTMLMMSTATVAYLFSRLRQWATLLFIAGLTFSFAMDWYTAANHTWLAVWTLAPIALFATSWWKEQSYHTYLRLTFGWVMVVAALQKVIAGTYLDGSYVAWMSLYGSTTERALAPFCSSADTESCAWFMLAGTVSIIWQLFVGLFLLLGFKNWWVIATEISFLLTVGLFADEMNFQVLNVALLCMAFRFGMPHWLAYVCLIFLWIDIFGVGFLIERFL